MSYLSGTVTGVVVKSALLGNIKTLNIYNVSTSVLIKAGDFKLYRDTDGCLLHLSCHSCGLLTLSSEFDLHN